MTNSADPHAIDRNAASARVDADAHRGAVRSLRVPNARIFFLGMWVSNVGSWAHNTAVVLLIRSLGGGGRELGLAAACQFGPLLLFGLKAGAIVDRVDRFRLLRALSVALAVVVAAMGIIVISGVVSIGLVLALTSVFGAIAAFENPTRRTFMTELVPPVLVGNVLSLSSSVMTSARMVGPALAALVATFAGIGVVFVVNGVSYAILVGLLGRLDRSKLFPIEPSPRGDRPVRDGLVAVWSVAEIRVVMATFAVVSMFAFNHRVGLPLLVSDRLRRADSYFGWLLSTMSVGNVIGALAIGRLDRVHTSVVLGTAGGVGLALATLSLTTSGPLALGVALVLGVMMSSYSNSSTVYVQQRIDPSLRSRVLALTSVLFIGSTPVGGPITGAVGDAWGAVWANLYGAVITICAAALGMLFHVRASRAKPEHSGRGRWVR